MEDPLQSRYLSVRWVSAMKAWLGWVELCEPLAFPALLIQGDADQTVDWRYNLSVYQYLLPDMQIVRVERGHHHLANETGERWQHIAAVVGSWCREEI